MNNRKQKKFRHPQRVRLRSRLNNQLEMIYQRVHLGTSGRTHRINQLTTRTSQTSLLMSGSSWVLLSTTSPMRLA